MNIITRMKNNIAYAYYRNARTKAFKEMIKHNEDVDPTIWKYWANKALEATKKCYEIPLK